MWRRFREYDLIGQGQWDAVCTKNGVPCFIIEQRGLRFVLRWQYNTFNHRHWEKMKRVSDRYFFHILFGAFQACTSSKRAVIQSNALDGYIEGVTLEEAISNANALFKIISRVIWSSTSLARIQREMAFIHPAPHRARCPG
jgi:hypothetical protein